MTLFNERQVRQLLAPIHHTRVLEKQGQSHISQQDVRAHLTRLFGFGNWEKKIQQLDLVSFVETDGRFTATYLVRLRLTVYAPDNRDVSWSTEDVATGSAQRQKTPGDAHDLAAKAAVSYALKRCATDLGDQFGLSLYNKGQRQPLVIRTLVMPEGSDVVQGEPDDAQEGVPQQVSLGHDDEGSSSQDPDDAGSANATGSRVASRLTAPPEGEGVACKDCAVLFRPELLRNGQCRDCWEAQEKARLAAQAASVAAEASAPAPGAGPAPEAAPAPAQPRKRAAKAAAPAAPVPQRVADDTAHHNPPSDPPGAWPKVTEPGSGTLPAEGPA